MTQKATAVAGSNIAFVKYWGNLDDEWRLPMNGSISMTLDAAHTTTTIEFSPSQRVDRLTLNGKLANQEATVRASKHLDHLRQLAGVETNAKIVSENSFPTGAGVASSAAGFAALTVAAAGALGLNLSSIELSRLSRLGSGSACRSIDAGFVEWQPGGTHEKSYATQLAAPDHWDLVDIIAIVSNTEKHVGSTQGHALAHTSPFYAARLRELKRTLPRVRKAIMERDLEKFGELIEADTISMHATMMSSNPSIIYFSPGTIRIMHLLRQWRQPEASERVGYFTLDAGPNVHVMTERRYVDALVESLRQLEEVEDIMVCGAGEGARLVDQHLF